MTTIQKFYWHDAATGDTGSLPGASSESATSPTITAAGASTNKSMDANKGTTQVAPTLTSNASTTKQNNWFRRFLSAPLADQTFGSGTWQIRAAIKVSNTSSAWQISASVYVWRPSTGALVGRILDAVTTGVGSTATTSETDTTLVSISGSGANVTAVGGDLLVVEVWGSVTQGTSTARTWTLNYDGTTEGSTTTNAAFVNAPAAITMLQTGTEAAAGHSHTGVTAVASGLAPAAPSSKARAVAVAAGLATGSGRSSAAAVAQGGMKAAGAGRSSTSASAKASGLGPAAGRSSTSVHVVAAGNAAGAGTAQARGLGVGSGKGEGGPASSARATAVAGGKAAGAGGSSSRAVATGTASGSASGSGLSGATVVVHSSDDPLTTVQKFYWHQVGVGIGGSLPPASSQSATSPTVTGSGASTNRLMDQNIGSSQTSGPLNTLASATKQNCWFRRFCSKPLADQTIPSGTWQLRASLATSASAAAWQFSAVIYVWRPSNGTLVGTIVDAVTTGIGTAAGTSETDSGVAQITASGSSLAIVGGDILVIEVWGTFTQTTATSRTWTPFYDGTTEGSTSSAASYVNAPAGLTLLNSGNGPGEGTSAASATAKASGLGAGAGTSSARAAAAGAGLGAGAGTSSARATAVGRSGGSKMMAGGRIDPSVDATLPGKRSKRIRFG